MVYINRIYHLKIFDECSTNYQARKWEVVSSFTLEIKFQNYWFALFNKYVLIKNYWDI